MLLFNCDLRSPRCSGSADTQTNALNPLRVFPRNLEWIPWELAVRGSKGHGHSRSHGQPKQRRWISRGSQREEHEERCSEKRAEKKEGREGAAAPLNGTPVPAPQSQAQFLQSSGCILLFDVIKLSCVLSLL